MTCFLCGRNGLSDPLDKHHIFGGANRKKSESDGLYAYLCHNRCHIFGADAAHNNANTMQKLHEFGEKKWLNDNPDKSIQDFINRYGKNYL